MLIDTNILIYAVDETATHHQAAREFLEEALGGPRPVGLPWTSLTAFVRITTHPRAATNPLSPRDAWEFVADWCDADNSWHPSPTRAHAEVLGRLVREHALTGNLVADGHVAALAMEHGLAVVSADSDFALFADDVTWVNPCR